MEPIQSALSKWMRENKNFKEHYQKIKNELLSDPEIVSFLDQHPELSEREIQKGLTKLYEYKTQSKQCSNCTSFAACQNLLQGYTPNLSVVHGEIHLTYEKCHRRLVYEKEQEQQKLVQSLHVPKEILSASMKDLYEDPNRNKAVMEIIKFLKEASKELPSKGLYLYGPFGVGKTYLLGVLANELKKINVSSLIIYMPEFVREIKSSFRDDTTNEKIETFKKADVLMLDDIGAEMQSAWFRDEVLGSVLQYRMMEQLPVFFTSNYSVDQLEEMLAQTKDGIETVKARRITERIRQVSKEISIYTDNKRK
ncbi:primosomal protein DnaI [Compostibacillus humi]|uniref:Primosomal protein DnaI n=1 Tax=Compostibacillus humi TaxID=1245525 RepID=A0A8J2ZTN2_9BACI|nr:primosomal protein DnaI [Compostibacillus humi]GGH75603.1 primosomal protein DnaI [Compostibacillus humi]